MFHCGEAMRRTLPSLLVVSLAVVVAGLVHYAHDWPMYWEPSVIADFVGWSTSCLLAALILKRTAGCHAPDLLIAGVLLYLVIGVGLVESAAVIFFLLSSILAGRMILGLLFRHEINHLLLDQSLIVGLALYLAVFGILIHYPVNSQTLYFTVLAAPMLVLFRTGLIAPYQRIFVRIIHASSKSLARLPFWSLTVSVVLLGNIARFTMFPTVGFDDNALHLRMWTELANNRENDFDVVSQIWAVAPFAVDLLHSIVSLLAGSDARSALNLAFLFLLLRQVWLITGYLVPAVTDRLLLLMLFVSTPILANLLTTLQTELFLALLATSGVKLALEKNKAICGSQTAAILSVVAMCCATKLPGAVLGLTILLAYAPKLANCPLGKIWQRNATSLFGLAAFILMVFFIAVHSYMVAWWITGNPVFPLYNGFFNSPYFWKTNFVDSRYIKGFGFSSYWNIFFKTSQHFESRDFVAGFQYLLLLPMAMILLCQHTSRFKAWFLLAPTIGFGLIMFSATQYWRYLFPVLPLAAVVIGSITSNSTLSGKTGPLLLVRGVIFTYVLINFYFLPGVSGLFLIPPQHAYTEAGRQLLTERLAPEKMLTGYLNQWNSGMRVQYDFDSPFGATLFGQPVYVNWYSPTRADRVRAWRQPEDVASFFRDEKIRYVIWNIGIPSTQSGYRGLLREHLSLFGYPEHQVGSRILYRVLDHKLDYQRILSVNSLFPGDFGESPQFSNSNRISATSETIVADRNPRLLASIKTGGATIARYRVIFRCRKTEGEFVAQLNWDVGAPYYRLVACDTNTVRFAETIPIPVGAAASVVYASVRGETEAIISSIEIETN